jgi:hypothetical protein
MKMVPPPSASGEKAASMSSTSVAAARGTQAEQRIRWKRRFSRPYSAMFTSEVLPEPGGPETITKASAACSTVTTSFSSRRMPKNAVGSVVGPRVA